MPTLQHFTTEAYPALQRQAQRLLHREPGATCAPKDLLHDAYLRLARSNPTLQDPDHGHRLYTRVMRRLLIDRSRRARAVCHGGHLQRMPLDAVSEVASPAGGWDGAQEVAEVLSVVARVAAGPARAVQLCQLEGYSQAEASVVLSVSLSTLKRWRKRGHQLCALYAGAKTGVC